MSFPLMWLYVPRVFQLHHFSWAQQLVLGDLRTGPQWESGLRIRTFRALARRGLVVPIERGDRLYRWKLTAEGARVVLALGIVQPWWARRSWKHVSTRRADSARPDLA